jgi:hypothetical protein
MSFWQRFSPFVLWSRDEEQNGPAGGWMLVLNSLAQGNGKGEGKYQKV